MRLSVSYAEDHIYPLEVYGPLQSLLLQSLEAEVRRRRVRHGSIDCVCVCRTLPTQLYIF